MNRLQTQGDRLVTAGLVAVFWFGLAAYALEDLWAASAAFGAITLLWLFWLGLRLNEPPVVLRLPLFMPSLAILAAFGCSMARSFDAFSTEVAWWGTVFSFLVFYLVANHLHDRAAVDRFFFLLGLAVIPLAGYCLWFQINATPLGVATLTHRWEIHANLLNSTVLAAFAAPWIVFYSDSTQRRRPAAVVALLCALAVVLLARSLWVWTCLATFLGWQHRSRLASFLQPPGRRVQLALALILVAGAAVYLKFFQTQGPVYLGESRLYWWKSAVRMFLQQPITGVGLRGFATAWPHFASGSVQGTLFAHGIGFQLLAETGFLGTAAVAWFGWAAFRRLRREGRAPFTAMAGIFVACASISFVMDYLLGWIFVALVLGGAFVSQATDTVRLSRLSIFSAMAALLLLIPLWVSPLMADRAYVNAMAEKALPGHEQNAIRYWRSAISLDSRHAESYRELAQMAWRRRRSNEPPGEAVRWLAAAWKQKKDVRILSLLQAYRPPTDGGVSR